MTRTLTPLLTALLLATAPMAYAAPVAEAAAPSAAAEEKVVYRQRQRERHGCNAQHQ